MILKWYRSQKFCLENRVDFVEYEFSLYRAIITKLHTLFTINMPIVNTRILDMERDLGYDSYVFGWNKFFSPNVNLKTFFQIFASW